MSKKSNCLSPEVRERIVRMVHEHRGELPIPLWATIESIVPYVDCVPQTLNDRFVSMRLTKACAMASTLTSEPAPKTDLKRKVEKLRNANEILKRASALFTWVELNRRLKS